MEEFHCGLTVLVVKSNFKCTACNVGGLQAEITRDLFTVNMSNDEVQKDLLAEAKLLEQALDYAVRRKKGLENQIRIRKSRTSSKPSGNTNIKREPVNFAQKRGKYKAQHEVDVVEEQCHKEAAPVDHHKINPVSNAETHFEQTISNSVRRRTKSAIDAQRGVISPNYASLAR